MRASKLYVIISHAWFMFVALCVAASDLRSRAQSGRDRDGAAGDPDDGPGLQDARPACILLQAAGACDDCRGRRVHIHRLAAGACSWAVGRVWRVRSGCAVLAGDLGLFPLAAPAGDGGAVDCHRRARRKFTRLLT